jgi:hypothetical protein
MKRSASLVRRKGFGNAKPLKTMARVTGLEPATSGVTGRRSNQLSYTRLRLEVGIEDRSMAVNRRGGAMGMQEFLVCSPRRLIP